VIATTTIASYVTLGGLGRFIYDGLAQQDYPQMIGGGILVAALALVTDLILALTQRYVVSRGITRRFSTKRATPAGDDPRGDTSASPGLHPAGVTEAGVADN
jgi:osmoprotectant transport system permease protein